MRVNLLPPAIKHRQVTRRRTGVVIALGLVVLGLLGAFFVLQQIRLRELEDKIQTQESTNAGLRQQIADLQEFDDLQRELIATRDLLTSLLAHEVRWSGVLRDISLVIPGRVWLATIQGTLDTAAVGATAPAEGTAAPSGLVGQISFTGFGLSHRDTALWLSRIEEVEGFVNPWVSISEKTVIGTSDAVQFTGSTDLSELVLARRGGQA